MTFTHYRLQVLNQRCGYVHVVEKTLKVKKKIKEIRKSYIINTKKKETMNK